MKTFLIILSVVVIIGIIWYVNRPKPDASVPTAVVSDVSTTDTSDTKSAEPATLLSNTKSVDNTNVKIAFKGFGPDKVHNGTFEKISSKLKLNNMNGMEGLVTVDMTSLIADNTEKLTPHLKSADFFDVVKYPTAEFALENIVEGKVLGTLLLHGVRKDISFPVVKTDAEYKATFNIDMKEFGIIQKFANEIVEVTVTVPLK